MKENTVIIVLTKRSETSRVRNPMVHERHVAVDDTKSRKTRAKAGELGSL